MSLILTLAMLSALAATEATPAPPAPVVPTTAHADAKAAPPAEKMICRLEDVIGSNFPKRVCHTAAQWDQLQSEDSNGEANPRRRDGRCAQTGAC